MKPFLLTLLLLLTLNLSFAFAQSDTPPPLYVTQYQLASDKSPVYGLFDLGSKPSIRFIYPNLAGGKLRFQLHGRHYVAPVTRSFSVRIAFEDVSGRIFQEPPQFSFLTASVNRLPHWFNSLENTAGCYGNQAIEVQIPQGTSVINFLGDDGDLSYSPNQLVGYISHIQVP